MPRSCSLAGLASLAFAISCGSPTTTAITSERRGSSSPIISAPVEDAHMMGTAAADATSMGVADMTSSSDTRTSPLPPETAVRTEMRCTLRISAKGIYVDGAATSRDVALAACKRTAGAVVILEEGAPGDEWAAIRSALRRSHVAIVMRGPVNDIECMDNPLAKGCP